MEDSKIVELYWQRRDAAITETDRKYGPYCKTVAYNILESREDSDECVNDTYLKAWNSMPDARPKTLSTYLAKITRNLAISRLRARNSLRRGGGEITLALEELAEIVPAEQNIEAMIERQEMTRLLNEVLAALEGEERRVFMARYFFMTPVKEIAGSFGFSESKVKSMLSRTRAKLRRYLKEEGLC